MENKASITVPLPQGFTGRILIHVEENVRAGYMQLPKEYIVGATNELVELITRAGYIKPPNQLVKKTDIAFCILLIFENTSIR
ncbi:hypothetical protein [Enterobacter mori]|uniref:hypothetical protein n=1 Tax=Enterobacter mori TaxID=539813 RepID=UPI003B83EB3D